MLIYCVKCRKKTNSVSACLKKVKKQNGEEREALVALCTECNIRKFNFISQSRRDELLKEGHKYE